MVSNVFVLGDLDYNISCVSYHLLWNGQPEIWLLAPLFGSCLYPTGLPGEFSPELNAKI